MNCRPMSCDNLGVLWSAEGATEERPGFTCYAFYPGIADAPRFPDDLWRAVQGATAADPSRLFGEGWQVFAFDVLVPEWPDDWINRLSATVRHFGDQGAEISWVNLGFLFADPPSLFLPDAMQCGVLLAWSRQHGVLIQRNADNTITPLSDRELLVLREEVLNSIAGTR